MSYIRKISFVVAGLCVISPAVFAQKGIVKAAKQVLNAPKISTARVPYAAAGRAAGVSQRLQRSFMRNWNLALENQAQRKAWQTAQLQRAAQELSAPKMSNLWKNTEPMREQLEQKARAQTQFIARYLAEHQNVWPVYAPRSQEATLLKRIANFMEVENPTPQVLYVQREIIRLRAASKARSPQEILSIVQDMMSYGIVPNRAYVSEENEYTEDELAVGEELAFAVAAYKVPVEENPWRIPGMASVIDKATTYYAMRRVDPLFEGLPATYVEDSIHKPNFPVWTRQEFVQNQRAWVQEHPFDYALALQREKLFGQALYRVYNRLPALEKESLLFAAPGLPQVADATAENFAVYYDRALEKWVAANGRLPYSRVDFDREEYFGKVLAEPKQYPMNLKFKNRERRMVGFVDLNHDEQVEVLLWIWQKYQILPQKALAILGKGNSFYY